MRKKGTQIGVNIWAVEAKTLHPVSGWGRGLLTYTLIKSKMKYIIQRHILSDDDMIYTYLNM